MMTAEQLRDKLTDAIENGEIDPKATIMLTMPKRTPMALRPYSEESANMGAAIVADSALGDYILAETVNVV